VGLGPTFNTTEHYFFINIPLYYYVTLRKPLDAARPESRFYVYIGTCLLYDLLIHGKPGNLLDEWLEV
jgi:hypothetical protein